MIVLRGFEHDELPWNGGRSNGGAVDFEKEAVRSDLTVLQDPSDAFDGHGSNLFQHEERIVSILVIMRPDAHPAVGKRLIEAEGFLIP
jgi:hypothetical protein